MDWLPLCRNVYSASSQPASSQPESSQPEPSQPASSQPAPKETQRELVAGPHSMEVTLTLPDLTTGHFTDAFKAQLEKDLAVAEAESQSLKDQAQLTEDRLVRAEKLTSGLADEAVRWKSTAESLVYSGSDLRV